jgi:hypothetical protein
MEIILSNNEDVNKKSALEVLNHHSYQKLKLIRSDKFNHLINTLTPPSSVDPNYLLMDEG